MSETRAALFVRLPTDLLARLDERIEEDGRTKQAVVQELIASQLQVSASRVDDVILDLAGVAELLRVDEVDVLARITEGDFPARRFGTVWRCSRTAVLAWLAGTDPVVPRATGFARG